MDQTKFEIMQKVRNSGLYAPEDDSPEETAALEELVQSGRLVRMAEDTNAPYYVEVLLG